MDSTETVVDNKLSPIHVRIKNFQSIEDLSIVIDGLTIISGRSNIGKSAIMRAISCALLGKSVIGLIRSGAPYCSVEMSSNGWGFLWEKAEKGLNRYTINGVVLDNPGQGQLDEIARMGFGSVKLGAKDVQPWLASQFYPIFLLGESGPSVTNFISEVSRLNVLQDAITLSAKEKRRAVGDAKDKAADSLKIKDRLSRISGTDQIIQVVQELEDQKDSIEEYEEKIKSGEELDLKLRTSSRKLSVFDPIELVKLPEDNLQDAFLDLKVMHDFWVKLEMSAKKIISLKASEKLEIPNRPEEEWEHLNIGSRFLVITKMKEKDDVLDNVKNVVIPSFDESEAISHIRTGESLNDRLLSSARIISNLSKGINIPAPPDDLDRIQKGFDLCLKLEEAKLEEKSLDEESTKLQEELAEVNRQISEIPSCPSCERPVLSQHSHM